MNNEMIKNIKEYENQIITLEDFVAGVRQNIGMYIGGKGDIGFINMIREILQNSLDEVNKPNSPATTIWVTYIDGIYKTIIQDNGRGIPFNNIIRVFQDEHTGSNYVKKDGEYSSGMHGVGAKVTNALSKEFTVDSYVLGEHRRVDFVDGHPISDEYDDGTEIPENAQGTRITFTPSLEVMGKLSITYIEVLGLIRLLLPITKIGTEIYFEGIDIQGNIYREKLVNNNGLIENLMVKTQTPLVQPIGIFRDTGKMKIEAIFTYDSNNLNDCDITTFANFCPTTGGNHEKGFIDGVCKFFKNYMNKIYLANTKKKINIISQDVLIGLQGIVHTCHLSPIFGGQSKDKLTNEDIYPFVRDTVVEELDKWASTNINDLKKVCKFIKDVAEIRVNADKDKIKLSSKYNASVVTGLPKQYKAPEGKKDLELIIVEGNSAMGSAENSRNPKTQGIFPIRGKTPNPFTNTPQKILANKEIAGIFKIIGCGVGKECDPSKCRFVKIIITSDRDPDGDHIAVNLSATFAVYMPQLVEAGLLYKSIPPLYSIKTGNKEEFFSSRYDYIKYVQNKFSEKNVLKVNGKVLSSDEIIKMAHDNVDYISDMNRMSRNTGLNPRFLEKIIKYLGLPLEEIQYRLSLLYGNTIQVNKEESFIRITGECENEFQTCIMTDRFIREAQEMKAKYLNNINETYELNGQQVDFLYDILMLFDTNEGSGLKITRYKGLGELDPHELGSTTLSPENRTLIRYTMNSIKEDVERLREFDSDKKKLIEGTVATRSDLLG